MMTNNTQTLSKATLAARDIVNSLKMDVGNMNRIVKTIVLFCLLPVTTANAATYLYHNDHLGTPQALTDANQQVVWQSEQDPFGKVEEVVNVVEQNLRFPGQYFDVDTGLYYNYFRDYDPRLGRYVQSDPLGVLLTNVSGQRQVAFEMGVDLPSASAGYINSTFGYADQNSLVYFDPTGENTVTAGALAGGAIGGPPGALIGAVIGAGIGVGIYLACSSDDDDSFSGHGENPEGQTGTGGKWDKHSSKRAGKKYGESRNEKRGKKNKKYQKNKNQNKN